MGSHALLSASSSKRWLNCPPSARLCAEAEDTTSEYAKEGTDAHTLCEYKVKTLLGIEMQDPTDSLSYYNEEMERPTCFNRTKARFFKVCSRWIWNRGLFNHSR